MRCIWTTCLIHSPATSYIHEQYYICRADRMLSFQFETRCKLLRNSISWQVVRLSTVHRVRLKETMPRMLSWYRNAIPTRGTVFTHGRSYPSNFTSYVNLTSTIGSSLVLSILRWLWCHRQMNRILTPSRCLTTNLTIQSSFKCLQHPVNFQFILTSSSKLHVTIASDDHDL